MNQEVREEPTVTTVLADPMLRATYSEVIRTVAARQCCACPRPESTCLHAPAARAFSPLVQPSHPVLMISFSLSAAARSQCIGTSGGKSLSLSLSLSLSRRREGLPQARHLCGQHEERNRLERQASERGARQGRAESVRLCPRRSEHGRRRAMAARSIMLG